MPTDYRRRGGHSFRRAAHFCPNFSIPGVDPEIAVGGGMKVVGASPDFFRISDAFIYSVYTEYDKKKNATQNFRFQISQYAKSYKQME